ncbi:MAG: hypothetical protein OSB09_05495 [Planctomycetota bacterium]|nr:hypothetical protein [Planctomycetota bacterium]
MRRFFRRVFGKELEGIRRLLRFLRKGSAPPSAAVQKRIRPAQNDSGGRSSASGQPAAIKRASKSPPRPPRTRRKTPPLVPHTSPRSSSTQSSSTPGPKRAASAPGRPKIRADRSGPLDREIAPSPSDPFTSVVASVVLHLALLLLLVPLLIPEAPEPPKTWSVVVTLEPKEINRAKDPLPTAVVEPAPQPIVEPEPVEEPIAPVDLEAVADPPASEFGTLQGSEGSRRSGTARQQSLVQHGGNAATESAVRAGLEWLLRHQDSDGSWSPDQFHKHCPDQTRRCSGVGYREHRAGITALSLLALLGDGHLPQQSENALDVAADEALRWLLRHQDESGCIRTDPVNGTRNLYDHGIATFALCEAAQWTTDATIERAARLALSFLASSQQAGGGWDYTPGISLRNDLSITGWQLLAIHAGIEAGILPQMKTITSIERYLDRAIDDDGRSTYSDRGRGRGRKGIGIDAVGLLSMLTLGHSPISHRSLESARRIADHPPRPELRQEWDQHPQSMYYWYTATLALFHVGGEPWKRWNEQLQRKVLPLQRNSTQAAGSWDPDPNWIGAAGGRVAQTALGVLTFESYFRYTPIHLRLGIARTPRDR